MDDRQLVNLENRQSKVEDAIAKLTEISSDLNKMLAVHELRITQQEKITDSIEIILEKRRDEFEEKIEKLYTVTKEHDENILDQLSKVKTEIAEVKRQLWIYMGGVVVLAFILANFGDLAKLLKI